jgi:cell filamentation protein
LRNLLGLEDEDELADAERDLSLQAAESITFLAPPYSLRTLEAIHRQLFGDVYPWAGQLRTVDISKGETRFCTLGRIEPEAEKIFDRLAALHWLEGMSRDDLVTHVAELYGDLNMIHPFRDGNGRSQRILFEFIVINAGYEIEWVDVDLDDWVAANVAAVYVNYEPLRAILEQCIGPEIRPDNVL